MCRRDEAKAARRSLGDAIGRFDLAVDTVTPAPPPRIRPTPALMAVAEIFRGAASTVPLTARREAGRRK